MTSARRNLGLRMAKWEDFLDTLVAGDAVTVDAFLKSAGLSDLPKITTPVRRLDPKLWGDLDGESE